MCATVYDFMFYQLNPLTFFVVDPCEAMPCDNGGTCSTDSNGFTCSCMRGFIGDTCDRGLQKRFILKCLP